MNLSIFRTGCVAVLSGAFLLLGAGGHALAQQEQRLTDPVVASKLGVSVQQLHGLRARFDLSNDDLLAMSAIQLQPLLWDVEHPGIDKHAEELKWRALRMMDEHGRIPPAGLLRAIEHRKHVGQDADLFPVEPDVSTVVPDFGSVGPLAAGIQSGGWTWLGPGNIGGRVRAILVHPTSTNIMWCGGVDGGVWKTTNSAAAWFPLNDFMANLAISCMVMDPTNANIIYAGTGEATYNADSIRGAGIFKTTDGGNTWTQLASTANSSYLYVSRLALDPNNGSNILAATRSGIFRSTDAGTSWSQRSTIEMLDIDFHPTDSSKAIASGYNGTNTFYSTDGGLSWTRATGLPAKAGFAQGRVEVTYSASNPTVVFASMDNNSGELYRSANGGVTYSLRNTGNSYLSAQGWYDNALWADPTTTNGVIVGGLDLWRSTDGGSTFTKISQWFSAPSSAHADHHVIVHNPAYNGTTVKMVFFGNDGGIYRAADVSTVSLTTGWLELNNNLGITQFYGGAGNSNTTVIVGGTQDNGDLRYTTGGGTEGWNTWDSGDGGFSAADNTDPNYFYGEYVYLQIHRSANGGVSGTDIFSGITDAGSSANFIAPFILDPNNPNTMLGGGLSLWRSTNVKAATPSWTAIKSSIGDYISAIAVAPGNSNVVWVGHNGGNVYSTTNGTAASPTWVQRDLGTPNLPNRYCERITIAPGDTNRVYVTFGGFNSDNVWRTSDGGVTWSNITGNLPAAPVNSLVVASADTNTLYVGTEVGVFGTSVGGATWSTGNDGPANVAVDELFWFGNKLVAVTHGRGMFTITPAIGGASIVAAGSTLISESCLATNGTIDPNETVTVNFALQNTGNANASNVVATLQATGGVTSPSGSQSYGTLIAGGAAVTNPFTFTASGTCGSNITATLQIQTNSVNYGTVTFSFTLGALGAGLVTNDYSSGGLSTAIPDLTMIEVPLTVGDAGSVADVNVRVRLNHTWDGDLVIDLIHPDGTIVNLASNRGVDGDNFGSGATSCAGTFTVFDDAAGIAISAGTSPFAGTFRPEQLLSALNGKPAQGTWKLRIADTAGGDAGTLYCWQLQIARQQYVCCSAPVDSDGDGLPDSWEMLYFGNLSQTGSDDPDGDGMTNLQEYLAGTNPTDPGSALRITAIARETNNLRVTWTMGSGKTNALQVTSGSGNGSFATNNFANLFIVTNTVGSVTNFLDSGGATNVPSRYYRVKLLP